MSADWETSQTLTDAQLAASIARADAGASASVVHIYSTARPATIATVHADDPQATITLAKPCGAVVAHELVWHMAAPAGAMVQSNGLPRWAEWIAGDGAVLARCDVTDMDHGGGLRVLGGTTPAGETSPMLYAGGMVQIGQVALT